MSVRTKRHRTGPLVDVQGRLWLVAILSFVVGDALTTTIGVGAAGVAEVGPLAAPVLHGYGLAGLAFLKVVLVGGLYAAWTVLPNPQRVGVPLGLTVVGVAVTGWNLAVLAVALLP